MIIKHLNINNLRNIGSAEIEPDPHLNILHGDNGAGKTSIIESVVVLAKGRSFRSGNITSLVGPQAEAFRVVARTLDDAGIKHGIGLERSADQWKARIDGKDARQISDLAPYLPLVLLEPNSHQLISGAPEGRRKFLDWGVFHVKHAHLDIWRRYSRVIKQRNAALRAGNRDVVASLDPQMVRLGNQLDKERRLQAKKLSDRATGLFNELSPDARNISLDYEAGWRGEQLEAALRSSLERDLQLGSTGSGPHRADLAIGLDSVPARERLSRGEQKVLAAALLLAQGEIMQEAGVVPLMLMDDLSSEFDPTHLGNVMGRALALGCQLWVTGTSAQAYQETGVGNGRLFHVKQGKVLSA